MPKLREMTMARTEAQTEAAPFNPQNQGIRSPDCLKANFIPIGNAIPMNNPMGNNIRVETVIRMGVVED